MPDLLTDLPPDVDPMRPEFYVRPDYFEVLAALRRQAPVHGFAPGHWALSRWAEVREVSRDPVRFRSGAGALVQDPLRGDATGSNSVLHLDPPEHAVHRALVSRRFTPRAVGGLEDRVRALAVEVIESAPAHEVIDAVDRLTAPFPLLVIAELLGIPDVDRAEFRRWSDATIESPDRRPEESVQAFGQLATFIGDHLRRRREDPGDDVVSLLLGSQVDGCPLDGGELFGWVLTLLVAGNETTRTLLSGSLTALAEHPDQRALLAAEPDRLPVAVEELLRWVTPIVAFCRTATVATEVGGQPVEAGDYLVMLYASANRDETVWGERAGVLDVTRPVSPPHLAFGFGEHLCLGAGLARLEARVFLEELLARYPSWELAGPTRRVASTTVAGIAEVPLVLAP